jgi:hypothetical protein
MLSGPRISFPYTIEIYGGEYFLGPDKAAPGTVPGAGIVRGAGGLRRVDRAAQRGVLAPRREHALARVRHLW